MKSSRREFLELSAGALAFAGCSSLSAAKRPEPDFLWSYLVHFGVNSWKDVPLASADPARGEHFLTRCQADHVRFDEASWRRLSARLKAAGCNQIVIDVAEILKWPSHPELGVTGSWSADRLREELDRLRGMGFEVVPKLNFSATHDTWLKDFHRMVSTPRYYAACSQLIADAIEVFDGPRLLHLGYDEETARHQADNLHVTVRQGDLWWHDFLYISGLVEKLGARPWIWSDYCWHHQEEFLRRMPKSILQSNWYYGGEFDLSKITNDNTRRRVGTYAALAKAGFDQMPCGSTYSCDENFPNTVRHCREIVPAEHLKGFFMAPWCGATVAKNEAAYFHAADMIAESKRIFESA